MIYSSMLHIRSSLNKCLYKDRSLTRMYLYRNHPEIGDTHARTHTHTYTHIRTHAHTRTHTRARAHTYTRTHFRYCHRRFPPGKSFHTFHELKDKRVYCTNKSLVKEEIYMYNIDAYVHACTRAYVHACIRAYVHACVRTCVNTCMRACVHTYMREYVHTYMRAYVHACIRAYVHACIRAYMRTCIQNTKP